MQRKFDDMKKSQAQCEETIRLKNKMMVLRKILCQNVTTTKIFPHLSVFFQHISWVCVLRLRVLVRIFKKYIKAFFKKVQRKLIFNECPSLIKNG